ncbi:hypothetical protein [Litorilituus lipolyticus]|uniref:Outer membrane protein beta-barrel domain-containing protein n=1 Tax=Litorilituus lipolyticus TaxID=2491017 RepID=A0A502KYL6_9GAMM|nr:hypothetical protein [Litorilituus lipolyticus]TPH13307.1 hypothetical protein EPA86_14030 [Litorilituus lipolyticus]
MNKVFLLALGLLSSFSLFAQEKHHEDPTKVITRIGAGYTDNLTVSGSLALDQVRKLNARSNITGDEWRLGGSWLFNFGIVNFSFSRSEYDDGGHKKTYSVGTFLPLSALGIDTGKWMIFPMAGFSHTNGEIAINDDEIISLNDVVMVQNTSNGGYLGVMALRPIDDNWTFMTFGGGGAGSGDYRNVWGGAGASYKINEQQSFNVFGFVSDDDYGTNNKLGISYTYEFD